MPSRQATSRPHRISLVERTQLDFTPIQEIADKYGCQMLYNQPLSSYTTMRIGGVSEAMIKPNSTQCLIEVMRVCKEHNIKRFVLGKGSNTLFSDKGRTGLIIQLNGDYARISLEGESGDEIVCEAGASLAAVCRFAYEHSLTGLEFAWGIPGSIGGAVYMNAGAYGGQMSDVVVSCEQIDEAGNCNNVNIKDMEFSYRHSAFCSCCCAIGTIRLKLNKGDQLQIKDRMDFLMEQRVSKQPLDFPSAGSTFKRPQGSYASLLIDNCKLKGKTIGGAQVSEKHAGFIINRSGASFSDVMKLVELVKKEVNEQTGYSLECEMLIVED